MKKRNLSKTTKTNNVISIAVALVVVLLLVYCWNNTEDYTDKDCNPPYKKYRKNSFINQVLYGYKGTCISMGKKAGWCCK